MTANYSIVHWGPIKYTSRLYTALSKARAICRRKGFRLDGKWHKLQPTDEITVFSLKDDSVKQVFKVGEVKF